MTRTLVIQTCILCGNLYIIWMQMITGRKLKVERTTQEYIICMAISDITMYCLLMMHLDLVQLDTGKSLLIKTLSLPLLLAPPHQNHQDKGKNDNHLTKAPGLPPPTPRPKDLPERPPRPQATPNAPKSGGDTEEKTLVLQLPPKRDPPGKRGRDNDPDLGPSEPKRGDTPDRDQRPQNPPGDIEAAAAAAAAAAAEEASGGEEGQDPGQPPEQSPQPPEHSPEQGPEQSPLGEGQVEGHPGGLPPPRPPPTEEAGPGENESLATTVASLLVSWESQFRQLVDDIREDLEGYWQRLMIPQ